MARVVTHRFRLQEPAGVFTDYQVGQIVKSEHEQHWYARDNSQEYTPPPLPKKVEAPKDTEKKVEAPKDTAPPPPPPKAKTDK